jgi:hypothetical protein
MMQRERLNAERNIGFLETVLLRVLKLAGTIGNEGIDFIARRASRRRHPAPKMVLQVPAGDSLHPHEGGLRG